MDNKPHKYNVLEHLLFLPTWLNKWRLKRQIKDKTILITGASYGIGEQLAYLLAKQGTRLLLVARSEEKLIEVKNKVRQLGGNAEIYVFDLSQANEVKRFVLELELELEILIDCIDIIINNAGRSIMRSIYKSLDRLHDFERTMAINYFGPVQLLLALIPTLEKSKGHIINVSAVNVLLAPAPYWAAYQASKSAFDQWFRSVAPEIKAKGITSSSIYLPLVKTRMIAPTKAYEKAPAMSPEHVAKIIAKTIYTKRRKSAPWWLIFGQLGSVIFRIPWEWMSTYFVKKKQLLAIPPPVKETTPDISDFFSKSHIVELIETGFSVNIQLAFMLKENANIPIDFSPYERLFDWLLQEKKQAIRPLIAVEYKASYDDLLPELENKLKFLFSMWELNIYESIPIDGIEEPPKLAIPHLIGLLKNLTHLSIKDQELEIISSFITELKELKYLNLGYNRIRHIPKEINQLSNLEELSLKKNKLKSIPSYLCNLTALKILNLSDNQINYFPKEIAQLRQLEHLDLSHNSIKNIPLCILDLPALKTLKISSNAFSRKGINLIKAKRPNFKIIFESRGSIE